MMDPQRIKDILEQVKDENTGPEDYDFIDEVAHPAPKKKGNDGLGSMGAWLSIYHDGDQLTVDKELIQLLDQKQADKESVSKRSRFKNIVMDSESRPGNKKSLLDQKVDGHELLENMIEQFEIETGGIVIEYEEPSLKKQEDLQRIDEPENHYIITQETSQGLELIEKLEETGGKNSKEFTYNGNEEEGLDISQSQPSNNNSSMIENPDKKQGGETRMGIVEEMSYDAQEYMEDGMTAMDAYAQVIDDYEQDLKEADMRFSSVETALREELAEVHKSGADLERVIGRLEGKMESSSKQREDTMDSIRAAYDNITDR